MLNIGLDIDDTITKHPKFFSLLSHSIHLQGGKVHVISSRTKDQMVLDVTKKELKELNILYDSLYLLSSCQESEGICPHKELDWYQKYIWQKVAYCEEKGVSLYFDDEEKVIQLFQRYSPNIQVFKVCKAIPA